MLNKQYLGQGAEYENHYGATGQEPLNHEPQIYELVFDGDETRCRGSGQACSTWVTATLPG